MATYEASGSEMITQSGQSHIQNSLNSLKGGVKTRGVDWAGAILRRKILLTFILTVSSILGYLFYLRQPKVYASTLKLMIWTQSPPRIVNREADLPIASSGSEGKHVNLLTSELVLEKAATDGHLRETSTFKDDRAILPRLRAMVSVKAVEDAADTLILTAKGPVPEDLPQILSEVVVAYQDVLSEDAAAIGKSSAELVEKLKDKILQEKSTNEERFFELIEKLGVSKDEKSGRYLNPFNEQLDELKVEKTRRERAHQEAFDRMQNIKEIAEVPAGRQNDLFRLAAIEASKALQIPLPEDSTRTDVEEQNELLRRLDAKIFSLDQSTTELRVKAQKYRRSLGDRHPTVVSILGDLDSYNSMLALFREQYARLSKDREAVLDEISDAKTAKPAVGQKNRFEQELVQVYLASLQRESDRLSTSVSTVDEEIQKLDALATAARGQIEELNLLASQIQQKDGVVREILDNLSNLTVVASNYTSTKVRVIDRPGVGYQIAPQLLTSIAAFVFAGGLLGAGLIVLLDWSDLSYRSPSEIKERLGLPVIARIELMSNSEGRDGTHSHCLVTIDKPKSKLSEAYRACRTTLLFMAKQHGLKTFLITSPSAGDGKSTSSLNLAACFAQGGLKTVVVDADLRRPRCHFYMGINISPGLKDLATGDKNWDEIIQQSSLHPNLSVITAGKPISNPSEFVASEQFRDLIDKLKSRFDIVIVDSPPVLPVADAMSLSSFCDGVLLVLRIRKGVVLSSEKAVDTLRSVDANLLGVLVNQVSRESHYSDYGSYGYSGYGGYAYYAGRYYDTQNSKYYDSEDKAETKSNGKHA